MGKRMNKIAGITALLIVSLNLMAQQDTKLTQSMFLIPNFNPGAVGQSDKICAAAAFRNQWMGFPQAPTVTTFTADAPFSLFGRSHGVGITMVNDNLALENDLFASVSYSYKIDIGPGVLGVGLSAGFANHSLDADGFHGAEVIEVIGDDLIPQSSESLFGFDMGVGALYSTENLYFGVSATHVSKPTFEFDQGGEYQYIPHYYVTGGYTMQLANPMLELMPSFLVLIEKSSFTPSLNANLRYNKRFWGGVSYVVGGAVSALFGVELLNGIKVGYSYDVELSSLIKHSSGTHEITVRYCFDLSLGKSPQKYESIRFL